MLESRFLVVDESEVFRKMIADLIRDRSLGQVEEASSLQDAKAKAQVIRFDIIALEYRIGSGNLEAVKEFALDRRDECGIVLLTAESTDAIPAEMIACSDEVFSKVFDTKDRIAMGLERLLLRTSSTVMIVDDAAGRARHVAGLLQSRGFRRVVTSLGGLEAILQHPSVSADLILADSRMKSLNLASFVGEIRKEDPGVRIVTFVSGEDQSLIGELLRAGVDDYLAANAEADWLLELIYRQLRIRQDQLVREHLQEEMRRRDRATRIELQLAADIQRQMLPEELPEFPGYRFGVTHLPSRGIGGDVYAFERFGDGSLGVLFADISGHGIPAALLSIAFTIYAKMILSSQSEPGAVLSQLGSQIYKIYPPESFASTLYLRLFEDGRVEYGKASQEPLLLMEPDGRVKEMEGTGIVLGLFEDEGGMGVDTHSLRMRKGDRLVLYTDGVTEAMDPTGEGFGRERFHVLLRRLSNRTPEDICSLIPQALARFTKSESFEDDLTVLIIERL